MQKIEQYNIFKLPVNDLNITGIVEYCATIKKGNREIFIPVFKSGSKEYMMHFMPDEPGIWNYHIEFGGQSINGEFECIAQTGSNHGPVVVKEDRFSYADGSRYIPFGTTCYAWTNQPAELQEQTLKTLAEKPFNKIRMCVFPKSMPYNHNDPEHYPFHKKEDGSWNIQDLDFAFWDNLEDRIASLGNLGIEADLILFHPYDRWGFATLSQEESLSYLEYCVARFAAYSNIWWSLANEYELLTKKSIENWDEYGEMLLERDPYQHLVSIHNILTVYPKRTWMTHCSIQSGHIHNVINWKQEYQLPVLIDECGYEGDIEYDWGNLSAFEMVHRFWWTLCRGGFCTHGETFHRDDEVLWWAKGGLLHGESPKRIQFLKDLVYSLPGEGVVKSQKFGTNPNLDPADTEAVKQAEVFGKLISGLPEYQREGLVAHTPMIISGQFYQLRYFGHTCPRFTSIELPENGKYRIEVIDIWAMTRTITAHMVSGHLQIGLPAKEGIAVLVTHLEGEHMGQ